MAAKAAASIGPPGRQGPPLGGSHQGDVTVRLAVTKPLVRPRMQLQGRGGGAASRKAPRPVGGLGTGRSGGNPREVRSLGAGARPGRALVRVFLEEKRTGATSVRVSSGIHSDTSQAGRRGFLGAGRLNMGVALPRMAAAGGGRRVGGIGARVALGGGLRQSGGATRHKVGSIGASKGGIGAKSSLSDGRVGVGKVSMRLGGPKGKRSGSGPGGKGIAKSPGARSRFFVGVLGSRSRGPHKVK